MPTRQRRTILIVLAVAVVLAAGFALWRRGPALPGPGSSAYEDVSRAFYLGLAALEVGLLENAVEDFTRATTLVPEEPASWANLGVARLRLGELDQAEAPITQALALDDNHAGLTLLAARMEIARGRLDEGIALLRRAVTLDPDNLRARFTLAEEMERSGTPEGDAEALDLLDEIERRRPSNVAVLIERARVAAKVADRARLQDSVERLAPAAASWPELARMQYDLLRAATEAGDFTGAARGTALLRNVLARVTTYGTDVSAVRTPADIVAEPFSTFIRLAAPPSTPAAPDRALTFTAEPLDDRPAAAVSLVPLDEGGGLSTFVTDGLTIRRLDGPGGDWPFPAQPGAPADGSGALLPLDWNNDFAVDLFAAGPGGVRLYLQQPDGTLADRTADAAAGGGAPDCGCQGAWAADVEMDGDLDIVLGVRDGATLVLRNNGDGTWTPADTFASVPGARGFAWADLDGDGDPDAAFLAGDRVRVFLNGRAGAFTEAADAPAGLAGASGLAVADVNGDGGFDLVVAGLQGGLRRVSRLRDGRWDEAVLAAPADAPAPGGPVAVFAADLDNNGALDLIRSGASTRIWLADEGHRFALLPQTIDVPIAAVADLNGDGRLDLAGAGPAPVRLLGRGEQAYHWKQMRVRAQPVAGDQRINPFGVGGEIEVRSGLLRQKQVLTGVPAHFGLGARTTIDVARIVWPNGFPQAEFGLDVDDTILAEQRLKGSCPWVFAFDGRGMQFVTDFLWRSPLGLRINAQDTAGVTQTEDWVRIRGDQLQPRDGLYDIRITAELWETHFFDHVSLIVVDHPADVEVYVDERFAAQPVPLAVQAVRDVRPVAAARDHRGDDVTALVARRDGRHLATFDRGHYQGVAREHFVEFDLAVPAGSPGLAAGERRLLVAQGWVYPTDSSINVAVGQGGRERPHGVALEYQTGDGRWVTVHPDLGFPAGKNKTMLIDLSEVPPGHRVRLRTNMEIAWDALATAVASGVATRTTRLAASAADLRYRGFSHTASPRGEQPETPSYAPVAARGQRWRDLVGYYTRFGDVRELLEGVDDRYVIMNAGDELALQFRAPAPPPPGWTRDFVLVGDGWEKDGDYNTEFSATVLPLPAHGDKPYDSTAVPGELEHDPVYRRHPGDWERYHTRYVRPDAFARGLGR